MRGPGETSHPFFRHGHFGKLQRYHPAIVAQASATLSEMFPARFWMAVGSGQALYESITGERWPSKEEGNLQISALFMIFRKSVVDSIA